MKKTLLVFSLLYALVDIVQAQGNYVFSGGEAVNFGTLDLATPGGQSWATDRLATPGYFSAYGASPYINPSNANNINGYVKQYVTAANQGYTFPVGTGANLRTLATSGTIANNSIFATAWIVGDPTSTNDPTSTGASGGNHSIASRGAGIISVSSAGQWDWQDLSATANGVTITVSIPDMTAFALSSNIRLVGWDGTAWQNLSSGPNATGNTAGSSLSGTMIPGISSIGIGSTNFTLPITIASFTAVKHDCGAHLTWTTATELNASLFDVEQSTDGTSFTSIGKIAVTGSGSTYGFTAAQALGIAYYRLKLVDKDASFAYSTTIAVTSTCNTSANYINIFPNPVTTGTGNISVNFKLDYSGSANLLVIDAIGQVVVNKTISVNNIANTATFSTSGLAKGSYHIVLRNNRGSILGTAQKFIKL